MVRPAREKETKLSVPARFRLPDLPGVPLPPRTFTSRYYDTADLRLAQAGITLRRRVEKRTGCWQLKLQQGKARLELESRGGPANPPRDLRDLLFVHAREAPLVPVATIRTRRTGIQVRAVDGPVAEVTLDRVTVLEEGRIARRWSEVEVEQSGDDPAPLQRILEALRAGGAGAHDQRPKLFQVLEVAPTPTGPPAAHDAVEVHLARLLQEQIASLLAHDPGVRLGTDPEALHQMRVATRRLRAYLRAARPLLEPEWADSLREELGWLGRTLGPARDLDVMAARLRTDVDGLEPQERRPVARLLRALEGEREEARRSVLTVLRSDRYLKLIDHLQQAARTPRVVAPAASLPPCAAGEFRKLRKAMRDYDPHMSDQALHRLRISVKRARYAAELAEAAAGKAASRFIAKAKVLQDRLGEHQDAVAAERHLQHLVSGGRGVSLALTTGMIIERMRRRRRKVRATVDQLWKKLDKRGQKAWGTWLRSTRRRRNPHPSVGDEERAARPAHGQPERGA